MVWSNGKSGKGGNYYSKTKWSHPSNRRTTGTYNSRPRRPQRQGGQRSRSRAPVAYRTNPGAFTQQRKAYPKRGGYTSAGRGGVAYRPKAKTGAETHLVEVLTTNGVRLIVVLYFAAFLTLVVLAGRGRYRRRECQGKLCPSHQSSHPFGFSGRF
jgi:hypothetical protein